MSAPIKNWHYVLFATIATILLWWNLLAPGFVITLDMVFGPITPPPEFSSFGSTYPIRSVLYLLSLAIPGWAAQKVLLVALGFALFYVPVRFYPFPPSGKGEQYVAATFFAINPFVYERLLAGQWGVLGAYATVPALIYALERLRADPNHASVLAPFVATYIMTACTIHALPMAALVIVVYATTLAKVGIRRITCALFVFIVASLYWIVPTIIDGGGRISQFDHAHIEEFRTTGDLGDVLSLYGFWIERHPWIERFVTHRDPFAWTLIVLLIGFGIAYSIRNEATRPLAIRLIVIASISAIFSAGIGWSAVQPINRFLFEHVPFWEGFRDTQKWSILLAAAYAAFAGAGLATAHIKRIHVVFAVLVPVLYTPMVLFGMGGQLRVTQYPDSWYQVDDILRTDPSCSALFLPWHGYFSLSFNGGLLAANPADTFFHCRVVRSRDAELGEVRADPQLSSQYYAIDTAITASDTSPDQLANVLDEAGIEYVISTTDLADGDPYAINLREDDSFILILSSPEVYLYRLAR